MKDTERIDYPLEKWYMGGGKAVPADVTAYIQNKKLTVTMEFCAGDCTEITDEMKDAISWAATRLGMSLWIELGKPVLDEKED